jgi:hypothetical protein
MVPWAFLPQLPARGISREKPDVKGFVLKGFTAITSMMGTEPALKAVQGNA